MSTTNTRPECSAITSRDRGRGNEAWDSCDEGGPLGEPVCFEIFLMPTVSPAMWGDCDVHDAWILQILSFSQTH